MLGRLLIGILKGVVLGALLGFGLAKLGLAAPPAVIAYAAAAVTGVLIGLVAGKPIWAKDAKIEAGTKAFVGALLAALLMYAARRWLSAFPVPVELGQLAAANESLGETSSAGTFGGLAITSLAAVAALLGGFYEADNDPSESNDAPSKRAADASSKQRIAPAAHEEEEDDLADESEKKRSKK
jgi:hypothetical protein